MSNKSTNYIAALLLLIMFLSAFFSMRGDSTTMDELAHISAGYSYLSQKDFRINPEHPPLIKDLAAFPLLFLNLNFPKDSPAWTTEVNGQWWLGSEFLYHSGNNADRIVFWARIPMILLLIFLGWFLFRWTKKEFGNKAALLVLTLFSFSPNFLGHGRLVTTDIGATLGLLLATYFWLNFLKNPSKTNVVLAGLIFGLAMTLKFSLILLIPFFGIITIIYVLLKKENIIKYLLWAILAGLIGVIFVILPVYQFHVLNYPPERQLSDTQTILQSSPFGPLKSLCIWAADKPIARALGHYLLGLLMATQRVGAGNTVYFMGMTSASGWWYYFPVVYFLKNSLSFHILTLLALILALMAIRRPFRIKEWILSHFTEFSMLVFLAIYWATSISGSLNIGVRHIFPVFPFTYILIVLMLLTGLKQIKNPSFKKAGWVLVLFLMAWYVVSSLATYPYYLSYFSEAVGGTDQGYKYVVDSNYDWGQDLKRLDKFVEQYNIEKIKVDYFGGGDVHYYLGNKAENLDSKAGPQKGWLAISATFLQGGRSKAVHGFNEPTDYYRWLNNYTPKARAGKSIFIYFIP